MQRGVVANVGVIDGDRFENGEGAVAHHEEVRIQDQVDAGTTYQLQVLVGQVLADLVDQGLRGTFPRPGTGRD